MNPSGSEFTLRVAICDLVERLKRMQHKCTYLEECRNQLVKEVIRLRLQNEWLARQVNDSPEISSLPQNIQCYCNQQNLVNNAASTTTSTLHTAHCHLMNGREMNNHSSNDDLNSQGSSRCSDIQKHSSTSNNNKDKDESIHLINILNELDREDFDNRQDSIRQLTIQMLKDLDEEMKTGQLKTDLINFVKNHLQPVDDELIKFGDQLEDPINLSNVLDKNPINHIDNNQPATTNMSTDYEAFNNNSDYYSNSHNLNVPLEDLRFSPNVAKAKHNKDNLATMLTARISNDQQKSPNKSASTVMQAKTYGGGSAAVADDDDDNDNRKDFSSNKTPAKFNSIDLVAQQSDNQSISIINSLKNDLKYLYQEVLASTDKLNKIKSRQLRYFFQKQINLDHNSNSNNNNNNNNSSTNAHNTGTATTTIVKQQQ